MLRVHEETGFAGETPGPQHHQSDMKKIKLIVILTFFNLLLLDWYAGECPPLSSGEGRQGQVRASLLCPANTLVAEVHLNGGTPLRP